MSVCPPHYHSPFPLSLGNSTLTLAVWMELSIKMPVALATRGRLSRWGPSFLPVEAVDKGFPLQSIRMQSWALAPYVSLGEGSCPKQGKKIMLPSRETERNKAEYGGRLTNTASVPGSIHTCSPQDMPFMWVNKQTNKTKTAFACLTGFSVTVNWKKYD